MQEIRYGIIDGKKIPVLISDETEALLAAKAAGMASVGLWRKADGALCPGGTDMVVLNSQDIDKVLLERAARRTLGLPWNICETDRLRIREINSGDYEMILKNNVGKNLDLAEKLESYVRHQYPVYGFGLWAVVEKKRGSLCGIAGVFLPQDTKEKPENTSSVFTYELLLRPKETDGPERSSKGNDDVLELGYHIFPEFRNLGYAGEACRGILTYAKEELDVSRFQVRIEEKNTASLRLAKALGFQKIHI